VADPFGACGCGAGFEVRGRRRVCAVIVPTAHAAMIRVMMIRALIKGRSHLFGVRRQSEAATALCLEFCIYAKFAATPPEGGTPNNPKRCLTINRDRHRTPNYLLQTGRGCSTISHFTFGSFSFERVSGRFIATARSAAFTSRSQAQRIRVFSVSLPIRFETI